MRRQIFNRMMRFLVEPYQIRKCVQVLTLSVIQVPSQKGMNNLVGLVEFGLGAYRPQPKSTN